MEVSFLAYIILARIFRQPHFQRYALAFTQKPTIKIYTIEFASGNSKKKEFAPEES